MIMVNVKSTLNFPEIDLMKECEGIADKVVIPRLGQNIDEGVSIDGGALPKNEPETIAIKGHSRPLIGLTGKLRAAFIYKKRSKNSVVVTLNSSRLGIGLFLQNGIDTKKGVKKYRFFGINETIEKESLKFMRVRIAEIIKNARR
jgi:hypothetical protein